MMYVYNHYVYLQGRHILYIYIYVHMLSVFIFTRAQKDTLQFSRKEPFARKQSFDSAPCHCESVGEQCHPAVCAHEALPG